MHLRIGRMSGLATRTSKRYGRHLFPPGSAGVVTDLMGGDTLVAGPVALPGTPNCPGRIADGVPNCGPVTVTIPPDTTAPPVPDGGTVTVSAGTPANPDCGTLT